MMPATATVRILVDNRVGEGLTAEHGLALWIETDGRHILFDTGQGTALEPNARALGIDLGQTDVLVLSHGHYDHTGGVPAVLGRARHTDVYAHPGIVHPRYSIREGLARPIHMPREAMAAIDSVSAEHLHWVQESTRLSDRIGLSGPIPRETRFEDTGGPFYLDPEGGRADLIDDDLALWVRTDSGVIVCVGCSHAGLVNTLNHVERLSRGLPIRAVIGGFHLLNASRERLEQTSTALRRLKPERVIPCHCTGELALALLLNTLADRVTPGAAGMAFTF
jgi:7,8-dihydropterin-6-yl-methyl-4-(beta-D-ribofuranosyl)aminobenzene 5'-phosphate synthase